MPTSPYSDPARPHGLLAGVPQSGDGSLFHVIFEKSPEAIALTRARDGLIADVNEEWVRLTGFSPQEVIGRTAVEIGHWSDEDARASTLLPLKRTGRIADAEVSLTMKDGAARVMRMNAALVSLDGEEYILIYLRDVTAERLAQEALRAGERVLEEANRKLAAQLDFIHKITARAPGMVYEFQSWPDGRYRFPFVSKGSETLIGVPEEQLRADPNAFFDRLVRDDLRKLLSVTRAAARTLSSWQCEFRVLHVDGSQRWLLGSAIPEAQADGSLLWCGSITDIGAHREAMEKLRESEARFRSLTELSSDWYWEQDEEFRFTRIDGNLAAVNVAPQESYLGRTRWDSGVQGVSKEAWDAHRAALEAHEVFHDFEMQRIRNDGSIIWASISGAPVFDANGKFKGYRGTGRDVSARKQAEADIERLAFFDSLTGLPNRRLLIDRLTKALEYSARRITHGALLFIDLDNFKVLNDTLGHHMGDELLQQVAKRLGGCVRSVDTVARLGGDEFVVMLEELGSEPGEAAAMAETVGKKILLALNQAFELGGQRHHSSPSIGITLFFQNLHTVDELLKRADLAMYQSKAAGRNTFRFFDPVMQAAATERAKIEADLRQALMHHEFLLYYQPVVDEHSRMTGVEALIRWKHPTRGMVSPADFIPVAEHTGLILPMGQWVLRTACMQLVEWSSQPATQRLSIAVNVSTRQFRQPEFSDQLLALLRETGANPYRLKLELTESLLLNEMDDAINKMTELRSIGVSFSLDDFGTGYSSLSYLKRLPLDQLKIDQSFVRDVLKDPNDAAIARTILNLAANLDLGVVAEGVETAGQREFLLKSGCKAFQGYLFGRPVPVDQLTLPTS